MTKLQEKGTRPETRKNRGDFCFELLNKWLELNEKGRETLSDSGKCLTLKFHIIHHYCCKVVSLLNNSTTNEHFLFYELATACVHNKWIFLSDRTAEEWTGNMGEQGEWHAAKGHRWNRTHGNCSKDKASVYGAPALPTEPRGGPH